MIFKYIYYKYIESKIISIYNLYYENVFINRRF